MAFPSFDTYNTISGGVIYGGLLAPVANTAPLTLGFDAQTPEQISIRAIVARTLAAGTTCIAEYRLAGTNLWRSAGKLALVLGSLVATGASFAGNDAFSGAIFDLAPGATYDVRLTGTEPGVGTWQVVGSRGTRALPGAAPAPNKTATPSTIAAQLLTLVPGDCLELADGTYPAITLARSGSSGSPIYIRGASRAGAIISSGVACVTVGNASHVVVENLTLQGSGVDSGTASTSAGVTFSSGLSQTNITFRSITGNGLDRGGKNYSEIYGCLVYNCIWNGNNTWDKTYTVPVGDTQPRDTWNDTGFGGPGSGNCVFNCDFTGFGDTIKFGGSGVTHGATYTAASWVYRVRVWRTGDDAIEFDTSSGNVGMYDCIIHNAGQAASFDEVYGGPVYFFRNSIGNTTRGPLKPSSFSQNVRIWCNTFVRPTGTTAYNFYNSNVDENNNWSVLNNLIVYRGTNAVIRWDGWFKFLEWDYNGIYPSTAQITLGATRGPYANLAEAKAALAPLMAHDVAATSNPFAVTITMPPDATTEYLGSMDFTLAAGSNLLGAGVALPGITDGFSGSAPAIGAVIPGRAVPAVGAPSTAVPTVQIAGTTWTPNKDETGAVLTTDRTQLPVLGSMLEVAGASATMISAAQTPYYVNAGGGDGIYQILDLWNGFALDRSRRTAYGWCHGGHGGTRNNENAAYALNYDTLAWTRILDRSSEADLRSYSDGSLVNTMISNVYNVPQGDGRPGSTHVYDGLVWVPPGSPGAGAVKGGLVLGSWARAVLNLDDNSQTTMHWLDPNQAPYADWSYACAVVTGDTMYQFRNSFYISRYVMAGTQATTWSATSFGQLNYSWGTTPLFPNANRIFVDLVERGECVSIAGNQAAVRIKYAAAHAAGVTNWAAYTETITLTSANGTDHLDFSSSNLQDLPSSPLQAAGADYHHATGTIWITGNLVGGALYRIAGINTTTWTVYKVPGVTMPRRSINGGFGKTRVITHTDGAVMLYRTTRAAEPLQTIRIS